MSPELNPPAIVPRPAPLAAAPPHLPDDAGPDGTPINLVPILEAMRCFSACHVPEIQVFLRRLGLPAGGTREVLLERVRAALLKAAASPGAPGPRGAAGSAAGPNPIAAAFDYIDELKENGEQHIFLFRLPPENRAYLEELADADALRGRMERWGLPDLRDRSRLVLEAPEPELAAVVWRPSPRDELLLKWVETRVWLQKHTLGDDHFAMMPHSERAVSFFRVDLRTGDAELRLQSLHPNAERKLPEEVERYLAHVGELIDLARFTPVLLAPVMEKLLLEPRGVRVRQWRVDSVTGQRLEGSFDPDFVQRLPLRFGHFSPHELAVDWPAEEAGRRRWLRVCFDGRNDGLEVPRRCSRRVAHAVLGSVRRLKVPRLRGKGVEKLARRKTELRPAFERIDRELFDLGRREVAVRELAGEGRLSAGQMEEASRLLAEIDPEVYRLRYRLICPDTGEVERRGDEVLLFETRDEIPPRVECGRGENRRHDTADLVEAVLSFDPRLRGPQLALRLHRKVVKEGSSAARSGKLLERLAQALGAVLWVGFAAATTALFLWLGSLFEAEWAGDVLKAALPFALGGWAGGVVKLVGDPAKRWASDLLVELAARCRP